MTVYTTTADYLAVAGDADDDATRAAFWLPAAERWVTRQVGRVFYNAADPTGAASSDWTFVTSLVVLAWRRAEMAEAFRLAAQASASDASGIKTRTIVDDGTTKTVTYRDPSTSISISSVDPLAADPRIAEIIAAYQSRGARRVSTSARNELVF